jgi:hypothetical protein
MKNTCENSRHANTLSELTCHVNTNSTNKFSHVALPKLTPVEHQLIYDNNGCLKSHCVFVPHHSTDCPNDFPNAMNYKPLMQTFVDLIKRCVKKPIAAIASSSNAEDSTAPSMPTTIAAVTGMSSNPTGDMAPNHMIVSCPTVKPTISPAMHISSVLTAHTDELALLTVLHLYWHCHISGPDNEFPVMFDALLDHGADTIFISEQFALSLSLKHRKSFQTVSIEMVMPR